MNNFMAASYWRKFMQSSREYTSAAPRMVGEVIYLSALLLMVKLRLKLRMLAPLLPSKPPSTPRRGNSRSSPGTLKPASANLAVDDDPALIFEISGQATFYNDPISPASFEINSNGGVYLIDINVVDVDPTDESRPFGETPGPGPKKVFIRVRPK